MRAVRSIWHGARRAGAIYVFPLAFALEVPTLLEQRMVLGHNWASSMEVANGSAVLVAILSAVGTCLVATAWGHTRSLTRGLPSRSAWLQLIPAAVVGAPILAIHLMWFIGVLAAEKVRGVEGWPRPFVIIPALLAIGACSLLGAAVGGMANSWLAGPILGVALYVGLLNSGATVGTMIRLGGLGMPLVGLRVRPEVLMGQVLWWSATCIALGLLSLATKDPVSGRLILCSFASAAAIVIFTQIVMPLSGSRFEIDRPLNWNCYGQAPRLCHLEGGSETLMEELQPRFSEASRRWSELADRTNTETYWQRLELPVEGHVEEVQFRRAMSDLDVAKEVISSGFPCSAGWSYEQYLVMEELAARLVEEPLSEPAEIVGVVDTSQIACRG
jgi:hypothetical protein